MVSAEDLIFFKLYAGGAQNKGDIMALLARCRLDEERLHEIAERYRMTAALKEVLG